MSDFMMPINLTKWVDENRQHLKPPVANRLVFEEQGLFIMVVGGPNARKDFHINEGAEFFYQLEGDMLLKVIDNQKIVDIPILEKEVFLLPPKVPHSPQRFDNTIGLVIERRRRVDEKDGLQWYCDQCEQLLYESYFHLKNIETDFPPVFDAFYVDKRNQTCQACGHVSTR